MPPIPPEAETMRQTLPESETMPVIHHLTTPEAWQAAQTAGEYTAPSLTTEGFIHCAANEPQTLQVAQRLYPNHPGLIVLDVDPAQLTAELKQEPSRTGEIYPHIYGPINLNAVTRTRPLTLDPAGHHQL